MKFCLFMVCLFLLFLVPHSQAKPKDMPHDSSLNNYYFYKKLSKAKLHHCDKQEDDNKFNIDQKTEYDLDTLVKMLMDQNFLIRLNAEKVFQAKQQVNLEVGKLLPSLSFATGQAAMNNDLFTLASQMIGFIFPSNWFRFEESKLFFQAEQWGHKALQANQINGLLALSYQINYLRALYEMLDQYRLSLKDLLDQAEERLRQGEDRLDQKLKIENIYLMLVSDQHLLEASIQKSYYQLAFVIDLEEEKWNDFGIAKLPFPKLDDLVKIKPSELEPIVLEKSPEMMQFLYLQAATKYSLRARMFDFLSPFGGQETALGFGYLSQIKIGRSQAREVTIKLEELRANLKLAIYRLAQDHNTALDYYKNILLGLENSKKWFSFLTRKFFDGGEYDAQEFLDAITSI